jgi:hypothetical protein
MDPVPPQSNDFERLQRLLALKRHESPPPGFFNRFPDQVRARITQADLVPESWWQRWLAAVSVKPAWATAYAVVASLLVIGGVWLAKTSPADGGPQLANSPAQSGATNPPGALLASNAPPPGLFNTPSLPVQPAEFKR